MAVLTGRHFGIPETNGSQISMEGWVKLYYVKNERQHSK
jgi:hypothetical protein